MRVRKIIGRYVSRSHCVDHFAKSLFLSARSVCVCAFVCVSLGPAFRPLLIPLYRAIFARFCVLSTHVFRNLRFGSVPIVSLCAPPLPSPSFHCDRSRLFVVALCRRFGVVSEILLEINMLDCLMIAQFLPAPIPYAERTKCGILSAFCSSGT